MRTSSIFIVTLLAGFIFMSCHNSKALAGHRDNGTKKYVWQESDSSLALLQDSRIVWKLNFNKSKGKPFFSPLHTVGGHDLVWLQPDDHPWHYGLWFSWKYINHINFWEEDKVTGISEGKARVEGVSNTLNDDFSARIKMNISYAKEVGHPILLEQRTLKISAPDKNGNYYIDWDFHWTAQKDTITLDRTVPQKLGGPKYGGYAGLSYRAAPDMSDWTFRQSNDWETKEELIGHGEKGKWMDLSGNFTQPSTTSGVTMFNDPKNTEGEVPWYIYKKEDFAFFNASPLFNGPTTILPGESMDLHYRVLIHGEKLSRPEIDNYFKAYINQN